MDFNSLDRPQYLLSKDKCFGGIIKEEKQAGSHLPSLASHFDGRPILAGIVLWVCLHYSWHAAVLPRMGHKQLNTINNAYPEL